MKNIAVGLALLFAAALLAGCELRQGDYLFADEMPPNVSGTSAERCCDSMSEAELTAHIEELECALEGFESNKEEYLEKVGAEQYGQMVAEYRAALAYAKQLQSGGAASG